VLSSLLILILAMAVIAGCVVWVFVIHGPTDGHKLYRAARRDLISNDWDEPPPPPLR
jgi:hypothetical protein